ncbi:NACHT domain-containing protein [Ectopseudomonas khazarica]|uniref:NACHT domain-containing protein n=1 Tax=Ectopseudomonas khazarica TaxID=2502979 RepID=UPI00384B7301
MTGALDEYIPLDRTFHELTLGTGASDDVDLTRRLGHGEVLRWPNLLSEYRVILLSEAGSGKTEEIRSTARKLRQDGTSAFFVRIEHISQNFEDAFEEGSFEEFRTWAESGEEGWLLLDSVDEARLRDPKDFERAIRKLGRLLSGVLQHVHIVITGRTTAWRAKTDLLLCRAALPYRPAENASDECALEEEARGVATQKVEASTPPTAPFKIVALDDLHGTQIDTFLRGKKVQDSKAFRDALDRKDAWSLTTRPQDLAELIEFWNDQKRIGSRFELMQSSIVRRLEERDQDRSEARPIATKRLRLGAQLVAAATTLAQDSAIRVPDGADNAKGIAIREVLTDWDDIDCATLLSRPIFDEGIYGTVRFHHRSVREYLTAEWLHALIVDEGSRARIEGLFFRSQYGIEVIVPTMRPVLSWLAILDERILARVSRLAPEVLFEGGDPSQLPRETRSTILRQACEQLSQPAHGRSLTDYSAVQRFANVDLTEDIKALLAQYGEDNDIAWFLLRMVWQGEIAGVAAEAKDFALNSRNEYTRIAAFRALAIVGSASDQAEVRRAFLVESEELNRDWLAELIPELPYDDETLEWLLRALERAPAKEQFSVDSLMLALSQLVADWPLPLLPRLVNGLNTLLKMQPVIERRYCEMSTRYSWLAHAAAQSVLRLIEARDLTVLEQSSLSILRMLPSAREIGDNEFHDISRSLSKRVVEWTELNHALFWHDVTETRAALAGERLAYYWQVGIFGHYWTLDARSFDTICNDIAIKLLLDDKLVALTLAFSIYRENGRPPAWRIRLKSLSKGEVELESTLNALLHPPAKDRQKWRQQEAHWKKRAAQQAKAQQANERKWKEYLDANVEALRNPGKPGVLTNAQHYLLQRMRKNSINSSQWSEGNWRSIIPEFGESVAQAFRDGAVSFWRSYRPQLLSEGAEATTTPFSVIFGLTGLSIEAREDPDWTKKLSHAGVDIATRFALLELNGFPNWLPALYIDYPETVIDVVMTEIDYELSTEKPERASCYVLPDASWSGSWMWDRLAPLILVRLRKPPKNIENLRYMLSIVQGSSLDDTAIAKLASQKAKTTRKADVAPIWFAMWVGVDPAVAIPALAARLAELKEDNNKIQFAMHFLVALVGGRREGRSSRQAYRTVEHMKSLYLLMSDFIRRQDDINRVGKGIYSPELRDDAQDARDALFSFIRETPGKEAFLALMEISRKHPAEASRPWMAFYAKKKATLDADAPAWSPLQVRDFHDRLERTPTNHRDLWYLAVDRLLDLKHDLEDGDASIASILQPVDRETDIRKYIGNWCREHSGGRYVIPQEEELADAKRPDLRFHGVGFDGPVPTELKLSDKWTGPHLFERLEIQLCGDYLRDKRSSRGIFLLVYHGTKTRWDLPNGKSAETFDTLLEALQNHWTILAPQFPGVEEVRVIGIDLTKRGADAKTQSKDKAATF